MKSIPSDDSFSTGNRGSSLRIIWELCGVFEYEGGSVRACDAVQKGKDLLTRYDCRHEISYRVSQRSTRVRKRGISEGLSALCMS